MYVCCHSYVECGCRLSCWTLHSIEEQNSAFSWVGAVLFGEHMKCWAEHDKILYSMKNVATESARSTIPSLSLMKETEETPIEGELSSAIDCLTVRHQKVMVSQ